MNTFHWISSFNWK